MKGLAEQSDERRRDAFNASSGGQAEGPTSLFLSALEPTPQARNQTLGIALILAILPILICRQSRFRGSGHGLGHNNRCRGA